MSGDPLLALACSATKSVAAGNVPAFERYDGPLWRSLRAALHFVDRPVKIWALSAQFGFIPGATAIPSYERKMTTQRAAELIRLPTGGHAAFADAVRAAGPVMFAGGAIYREAMRRACPFTVADISETDGGGIGYHRAQLRAWLAAL
jgi:hypothetical protein